MKTKKPKRLLEPDPKYNSRKSDLESKIYHFDWKCLDYVDQRDCRKKVKVKAIHYLKISNLGIDHNNKNDKNKVNIHFSNKDLTKIWNLYLVVKT